MCRRPGLLTTDNELILFLPWRLLLGDGRTTWSFTSAGICMCALSTNRQRTAMTQPSIASDIHQSLDVHLDSLPQVAFNFTLRFENRSDTAKFILIEVAYASAMVNSRLGQDRTCARTADTVDVCEPNFSSFVRWKIYASYTCHF